MAANRTNIRGRQITALPTIGGTNPGDPVLVGQLPGVSLNGGGAIQQEIDTLGVYQLLVNGINGAGNIAVNAGDIIYHDGATAYSIGGNTTPLSKVATGVRFGYAVSTQQKSAGSTVDPQVASGAKALCSVRLGY